ncbi:helix-turn-helix transcriptional regulator [Candidatus Pacearchaeota archaeon]|nr:helix-turn-helix transcriptional regulator [Candidatus Pacearchaeota archaeon]
MGKKKKIRLDVAKLVSLRHGMGLNQSKLSLETKLRKYDEEKGVSVKTISRIENSGYASISTIRKLADALDVEPKDLLLTEDKTISVSQHDDFIYLRSIENVLKVGMPEEPKWFRKSGPIAADFDDGRIYRREEKLNKLKELVMSNSVSMLEGGGAIGKTVLVLNLAYDLYKANKTQIYYFDCDKDRNFDKHKLIREIKNVDGIFILENLHLVPKKFQGIYSDFKHDKDRHILFVARPSFQEFQHSRSEDLSEIKNLTIEPFDEVDALIKNFSSYPDTPEIGSEGSEQIKEISSDSFWLLSYVLEGYTKSDQEGDAKKWLERGVKEDLNDLKNLNRVFPEVLVALSPLYQNEVLTAESYLIDKLKFGYEVLDQLVQRTEITRQTMKNGVVFYGLPHSALAGAYWECGQEYRKRKGIKEYEDFVCSYAASYPSNGLEAIVNSINGNICYSRIIAWRLDQHSKLAKVIENETSFWVIWEVIHHTLLPNILIKHDIQAALAKRIETASNFCQWIDLMHGYDMATHGACGWGISLEEARRIWTFFDKQKLAFSLSQCSSNTQFYRSVSEIFEADPNLGFDIVNLLNTTELKTNLEHDPVSENLY